MKQYKLLSLLFAVALAAASCGGGDDSAEDASEDTAESETEVTDADEESEPEEDGESSEVAGPAADATIPAAQCDEPGTVSVGLWDASLAPIVEDAAAQWVADYCPGAEVTFDVQPWDDYWSAMQIAAGGGGEVPDVLWMSPVLMPFYQDNGVVMSLQSQFDDAGISSDVWGSLGNPYTYDGQIYGAPIGWDTVAVAYNKELLDAAGVDVPTADWTWDDYATTAEAVAALDDQTFGAAGFVGMQEGYGNFIASTGTVPGLSADRTECTLTDPGSIETFEFFSDLIDRGIAPNFEDLGGATTEEPVAMMAAGNLGLLPMGSWRLKPALEDWDFEWGIVSLPKNPGTGEAVSISNAIAYTVFEGTEVPDLAFNLVQYLSSDEGSQFWVDGQGFAPANPDTDLLDGWLAGFDDTDIDAAVYSDALADGQSITVGGLTAWGAVNGELETRLFSEGETPEEAAEAICPILLEGN